MVWFTDFLLISIPHSFGWPLVVEVVRKGWSHTEVVKHGCTILIFRSASGA